MGIAIARQLLTLKEACDWASSFLGKNISESNFHFSPKTIRLCTEQNRSSENFKTKKLLQ